MIIDKVLSLNINFIESFGYFLAFIMIFLEGLPFVGSFIPGGSIIIFLGGFISRLGFLDFFVVLAFCFVGSFCVDFLGYLLGRRVGEGFVHRIGKVFFLEKKLIEKAASFIQGHYGKSMIIGKFNPVTRSFAPFFAGAHKISVAKFSFYNFFGSALWVLTFGLLGYVFGGSYLLAERFEKFIVVATVLLIGGLYFYYIHLILKKKNRCKVKKDGVDCKK